METVFRQNGWLPAQLCFSKSKPGFIPHEVVPLICLQHECKFVVAISFTVFDYCCCTDPDLTLSPITRLIIVCLLPRVCLPSLYCTILLPIGLTASQQWSSSWTHPSHSFLPGPAHPWQEHGISCLHKWQGRHRAGAGSHDLDQR